LEESGQFTVLAHRDLDVPAGNPFEVTSLGNECGHFQYFCANILHNGCHVYWGLIGDA